MVTRTGVGTTRVTRSDCGTKDSKVEDMRASAMDVKSMSLPDSLSQFKPGSTGIAGEPVSLRRIWGFDRRR